MKQTVLLISFIITSSLFAQAESASWNLPKALSEKNTDVTFQIDSTWHLVTGHAKDLTGRVWLENPDNFRSVRAQVSIPVKSLDTDNRLRDNKMHDVMDEEHYPLVTFTLKEIQNLCSPQELDNNGSCNPTAIGSLTIHGVSKQVSVPIALSHNNEQYEISGEIVLNWKSFGVADPSILIAKVDENAKVSFKVKL